MSGAEGVEHLLGACRFLPGREELSAVLPGIEAWLPPLEELRFRERVPPVVGIAVTGLEGFDADLAAAVVAATAVALGRPGDEAALDRWHDRLSSLCLRAGSDPAVGGVLALQTSDGIARSLQGAAGGEVAPVLLDLLRLRGEDPGRCAQVKARVIRTLVEPLRGLAAGSPLTGAVLASRLLFAERPQALYDTFDLSTLFASADRGLDAEAWFELEALFEQCIVAPWRAFERGEAEPRWEWFFQRHAGPELVARADALHGVREDGRAAAVARLLALQEGAVRYIAHHFAELDFAKRKDVPRSLRARFKTPDAVLEGLGPYLAVCADVLRWDALNSLRSLLRRTTREDGRLLFRGRALADELALDLSGEVDIVPRSRRGAAVVVELSGLDAAVHRAVQAEAADLDSIVAQLRAADDPRRSGSLDASLPFGASRTLDLFPSSLAALRWALQLVRGLERAAGEEVATARFAIVEGDYALLSWSGTVRPFGAPIARAPGLLACASVGGPLVARGPQSIRIGPAAFEALVRSLHVEGLPAWTPSEPDVKVERRRLPADCGLSLAFQMEGFGVVTVFPLGGDLGGFEVVAIAPRTFAVFADALGAPERSTAGHPAVAIGSSHEHLAADALHELEPDERLADHSFGDGLPEFEFDTLAGEPDESAVDYGDIFGDSGAGGLAGAPGGMFEPTPTLEEAPMTVPRARLGRLAAPASASLLGPLEADLVERIAALTKRDGLPEARREVQRPDFEVLFKDYVLFWVGSPGAPGAWVGIGRRYRDVLFDLHRFSAPDGAEAWGPADAIIEFLKRKAGSNYAPQSLSYERVPPGAQPPRPLTIERLERAYDRLRASG